jgi:hypothetical protein
MRETRPKYSELSPEEKRKSICRSYTKVMIKRGKLAKYDKCQVPGCNEVAQGHHPDYANPWRVEWVCRKHHNEIHGQRSP